MVNGMTALFSLLGWVCSIQMSWHVSKPFSNSRVHPQSHQSIRVSLLAVLILLVASARAAWLRRPATFGCRKVLSGWWQDISYTHTDFGYCYNTIYGSEKWKWQHPGSGEGEKCKQQYELINHEAFDQGQVWKKPDTKLLLPPGVYSLLFAHPTLRLSKQVVHLWNTYAQADTGATHTYIHAWYGYMIYAYT